MRKTRRDTGRRGDKQKHGHKDRYADGATEWQSKQTAWNVKLIESERSEVGNTEAAGKQTTEGNAVRQWQPLSQHLFLCTATTTNTSASNQAKWCILGATKTWQGMLPWKKPKNN